jgi:hypothetical protein
MMAYMCANIKNDLHGTALKGRSHMRECSGDFTDAAKIPSSCRIAFYKPSRAIRERDVFEDVSRDERQVVKGLSKFRAMASRSVGHEANSGDSRGNLQSIAPPLERASVSLSVSTFKPAR